MLVPLEPTDAEVHAALDAYWQSVERGRGTMTASFTTNHSMRAALVGSRTYIAERNARSALEATGDVYELANQLFGYSDESTPDHLAEFLESTGRLATALADRLTASEAQATDLRRKLEEARKALQTALVAMKLAAALPGVSDEYDFEPAIDAVSRALTSGGENG